METLFAILFTTVAASFGWGMRGTLLGHGKGALLPGMLVGFGAAIVLGEPKLVQFSWIVAAFGAIGMFPGGGMSYGETVRLVLRREAPRRASVGFALKGFLWFSVAAGFISFGIMLLGMRTYTLADTLLLFFMLIISRPLGLRLFNSGKNRLYFSITRKESWGENLIIFLSLLCVFLVHRDFFSITVILISGLGGAVGWLAGIWLYDLTEKKRILKRLTNAEMSNGWKLMEFVLGAVGGLGTVLGVLAAAKLFPAAVSGGWFESSEGLSGYIPQNGSLVLGILWGLLLAAFTAFCLLTEKKPWGETAEDWLLDVIYCAVPFLFLGLGSYHTACCVLIFGLFYVLAERYAVGKKAKGKKIRSAILFLASALVLAFAVSYNALIPPLFTVIFGIFVYWSFELAGLITASPAPEKSFPSSLGSRLPVNVWFGLSGILSVVFLIFAL